MAIKTDIADAVGRLLSASWDFATLRGGGRFTHQFHPYPAKFTPAIPEALLDALAGPGSCVLDPFAGSGTVLVEAVARGCHAIGVDINPLATLISKVKASPLPPSNSDIDRVVSRAAKIAARSYRTDSFDPTFVEIANQLAGPRFSGIDFWFTHDAQLELTAIRAAIEDEVELFHDQAMAAFSAVVVRASLQDSDTRYVRRPKTFRPLAPVDWFRSRLCELQRGLLELQSLGPGTVQVFTADARTIGTLTMPAIDLVITSSPYPNAFSYHLYHQLRCLWLGLPVEGLRRSEIGNHRDYSRRNGHDAATFTRDMTRVLEGLAQRCRSGSPLIFVIGDSVIRGKRVDNVTLLRGAVETARIRWLGSVARTIRAESKSLNPGIGRIKSETVCFMAMP
jgi:site-specific DNA-methyltransferase (cytosine-N4-specific)